MDLETNAKPAVEPAPTRTKEKRPLRWLVWLIVIAAVAAGAYLLTRKNAATKKASATASGAAHGARGRNGGAVPVSTATVRKGSMGEYISALGTVTSVYTVTVTSRVAGSLVSVDYREGQVVKKGDLLAVIDPRPYQATLLQAQGQLQRDQATLANSKIDLQRYNMAYSQHAIPEQTLATQKAVVNQNEGTTKVDQGNLDAAQVNVDYTQIRSPIDGRVGLRSVDPGNIVQANGTTPLLTITQIQPITVIFTMAEDYISDVVQELQKGHKLRVDALSRDNETELAQGTLLTLDNLVDTTTGTVKARAVFPNRDYKLFPNEFVNAKLLVKTLHAVNIVPNAAIQRNNEVAFVYVVSSAKTVKAVNVKIPTNDGVQSAVTGIDAGDVVVTDGFDKLQDGVKVVVRRSSTTPAKGAASQMNQSQENTQAPQQGTAGTNIDTTHANPQRQKKSRTK